MLHCHMLGHQRGGNDFVRHVLLQEPDVRLYQTPRPRGGA